MITITGDMMINKLILTRNKPKLGQCLFNREM
jgi:hypothetical protein